MLESSSSVVKDTSVCFESSLLPAKAVPQLGQDAAVVFIYVIGSDLSSSRPLSMLGEMPELNNWDLSWATSVFSFLMRSSISAGDF
jgi:hypothetical protein